MHVREVRMMVELESEYCFLRGGGVFRAWMDSDGTCISATLRKVQLPGIDEELRFEIGDAEAAFGADFVARHEALAMEQAERDFAEERSAAAGRREDMG